MPEIWKELEGFSKYLFSNAGKIWSKYRKRLVSVKPIKYGSDRVVLRNNEGKNVTMPLDIMIALAFIPNPENKPTVNHKNNDKTDNCIENLEWSCDEWKELTGFSKYLISSAGKIWSKELYIEISPANSDDVYMKVSLTNDEGRRVTTRVHRVIALAFIPNPENKPTVNHKNHDKTDNRVENLEWATVTEQNRHKKKPPREIQRLVSSRKVWRCSLDGEKLESYETMRDAAKWVFDEGLTSVTDFNNGNNIKTKICAVCQKRMERARETQKKTYQRKTAYGFKWIYDTSSEDKFENEIWKDLPSDLVRGTEGYQISDQGRVKNHKGRITEGHHKPNDYVWVSVYPYQYQLHRLIALVFLPNFHGKEFVNHKDHNKANCKLYNLEWVTASENTKLAVQFYSSKK